MRKTPCSNRVSRKAVVIALALLFAPLSAVLGTEPPSLPASATAAGRISDSALQQILALEEVKAERSETEEKIDSQLLFAGRINRNEPVAKGIESMEIALDRDHAGRVLVDVTASVSQDLLNEIQKRGGEVLSYYADYKAIRAAVPLGEIESLGARADVFFVSPAVRAERNTGSVDSEGDVAHSADSARTAFNVTGLGVKVAVLSDSVDYLAESQALGDLGNVTVLPGQSGVPNSGEGTAMLEIVHDIAPQAELYFATAFGSAAGFANNIRQLRDAGCDIIIDDVSYMNESPFQDDTIAQAVNEVTASGALYFASAGNSGNKNDEQSGVWEGDFADGGPVAAPISGQGRVHSFGAANYDTVVQGGSSRRVDLFWADPLGHAANDYDLFVLDARGANVVSASNNTQDGTQNPYEAINKLDVGQRIVVVLYRGASRYLHLSTGRGRLAIATGGRVRGHNSAADAFCVAAVSAAHSTGPFTSSAKVENFSSDGLRRVFFNADGSAITPGNFSATGGTIRQKPDVAAADGVHTTLPTDSGLNPFYGTSAAAPHAGAIAALLKSLHPEFTPARIRAALTTGTFDIEAAGVDRDAGYGLLMADKVLQAAATAQPPTITGFTPTGGAVGAVVKITGTKFTDAVAARFNGVSADFTVESATQLSATVPAGATSGPIAVTTPEGTATSANNFTVSASPAITGFSPESGNIGTTVTIAGANFEGTTSVSFGGIAARTFTINSSAQITAIVPEGAVTGKILVTTPNGTAQSIGVFSVTTEPVIVAFTPTSGAVGSAIKISGANFLGTTAVRFNGTAATSMTVDSASQITATVPPGATTGPLSVTTPAGTVQSAASFTVLAAASISGFTPASGTAGSLVTINGSGFLGATAVTFNGLNAGAFTVTSASQISATAPAKVTTGPLRVITPAGIAVSAASFTAQAAPPNDNFASAQLLSGATGMVNGDNVAATKEAQEPTHAGNAGGKSIWYRWSAPGNGTWAFDTLGSTFDTLLAVYTGTTLSNLSVVAYNDDITSGVSTNSRLTFTASVGTTYFIAVDGYYGGPQSSKPTASGQVVLNWTATTTMPAITGFAPQNGAVGSQVTISGANFTGATAVSFNGVSAAFTVNSASQIVATVPPTATTGPIRVAAPGGTATSTADFNVVAVANNDLFAGSLVISGAAGTARCSNLAATKEPGEPAHAGNAGGKSVWFAWTAPADGVWTFDTTGSSFDTLMGIYTGADVAHLTLIACNDDWNGTRTSLTVINATSGTTYHLAIDGYGGASGDAVLNWQATPTVPLISGFNPSSGGVGTAVLIDGVNLGGAIGVKFNGVSAPTFANNSSTQIHALVPAGASTGPIVVTTSNGVAQSPLAFVVSGSAPTNDNFAQRATLNGASLTVTGSNGYATKETGEPNHAGRPASASVWWTWTSPGNDTYAISTRGSDFDTVLAVYTGSSLAGLTPVASADDGPNMGGASLVSFVAVAGATYQIAVDGFNGDTGNIILSIYPTVGSVDLYSTAFEPAEGYNAGSALAGQKGWTSLGPGQNGVLANAVPGFGQMAYLGFRSSAADSKTYLWQPLNYAAVTNSRPVVTFSTDMQVVDSENFLYDDFGWEVFNQNGERLFFLDFDNYRMKVYYQLNDSGKYYDTGRTFQDDQVYHLEVAMDLAQNLWRATLNGEPLVQSQPISATNAVGLDLGDIDAIWLQSSGDPGDNYMLFDNYSVVAGPKQTPRIITPPLSQTANAGGNVYFYVGVDSPLELSYQWQFNGANIPDANLPTLTLNNLTPSQAGAYSVVVSNAAGSVTSQTATLAIATRPNLAPYKPTGWSDKIVATAIPGATNDSPILSADDEIFLSWAVANTAVNGNITSRFYTQLYVDGILKDTRATDGLNAGAYVSVTGYDVGRLAAGTHTLRLVTDSTDIVAEGDETDNSYSRTLSVNAATDAEPKLSWPVFTPATGFHFSFTGLPSRSYQILSSTNLTDWTVLATLVNSNADNQVHFADPTALQFSRRFYRVRLVP